MRPYILPNLLPYREIERKEQKKQFAFFAILSVLMGIIFLFIIATYYIAQIEIQNKRNQYIAEENKKLEQEIVKIKDLKEKLKTVLARKGVVEELQITRSDAVNLLNVFVQKMPDSMYLKTLTQQGDKVTIVGVTQSNAKVSAFMRALEDSQFTTAPQLVEIKSIAVANPNNTNLPKQSKAEESVSEFTMTFNIKRKPKDDLDPKAKNKKKQVKRTPKQAADAAAARSKNVINQVEAAKK